MGSITELDRELMPVRTGMTTSWSVEPWQNNGCASGTCISRGTSRIIWNTYRASVLGRRPMRSRPSSTLTSTPGRTPGNRPDSKALYHKTLQLWQMTFPPSLCVRLCKPHDLQTEPVSCPKIQDTLSKQLAKLLKYKYFTIIHKEQ